MHNRPLQIMIDLEPCGVRWTTCMPPTEAWLACGPAGAMGGKAPAGSRFGGAIPCIELIHRHPGQSRRIRVRDLRLCNSSGSNVPRYWVYKSF